MTKFRRKKIENVPQMVQHKWSAKVTDEGFVPFPKRLLRCLSKALGDDATFDHLRVILSIADYNRPNLLHPPSMGYLAFNAGLEKETFRSRLKELQRRGLVVVEVDNDEAVSVNMHGLLARIVDLTPEESGEEPRGEADS